MTVQTVRAGADQGIQVTVEASVDPNMQQAAPSESEGGNKACAETRCSLRTRVREIFDPRESLRTLLPCCSGQEEGPATGDRLACLDAVRAMAFMWVLHVHTCEFLGKDNEDLYDEAQRAWWLRLAFSGNCGVDVFFVLSGLLIARGNFKRMTAAEKQLGATRAFGQRYVIFLVRRFFRLWPITLLALLIKLLPAAILPNASHGLWKWGWTYLTFTANLIDASSDISYIGQLWSVSVEFQMYIITPFICEAIYDRRAGRMRKVAYWVLALISAASVALRAFWAYGPAQLGTVAAVSGEIASAEYTNTLARLSPYISGIAVAVALEERRANASARAPEREQVSRKAHALFSCLGNAVLDTAAFGVIVLTCVFGWQWSLYSTENLSDLWRPLLLVVLTPSFGWAIARCIYRTVTAEPPSEGSRFPLRGWRCTQTLLSSKSWGGIALLSYTGYVMQDFATELLTLHLVRALGFDWEELDWDELGVGTLRFLATYVLHVMLCCLFSLPCHFLVEVPGIRLGRRVEGAIRRYLAPKEQPREPTAMVEVSV